jgi:hypothetical protein
MNIIERFLKGDTVEQSTAGILEQLEEEGRSKRQQQAEQILREKKQTEEFQARNSKTLADFLKRKDANTREVNAHVVALLLALTDTKKLVLESCNVPFDGRVSTTAEVFGFPVNFADDLTAAIASAAPETQWDWSSAGQPKLKGPREIRVPRFPSDMAAPPGFVGTWDRLRGRPFEEPGQPVEIPGTSGTFLP